MSLITFSFLSLLPPGWSITEPQWLRSSPAAHLGSKVRLYLDCFYFLHPSLPNASVLDALTVGTQLPSVTPLSICHFSPDLSGLTGSALHYRLIRKSKCLANSNVLFSLNFYLAQSPLMISLEYIFMIGIGKPSE